MFKEYPSGSKLWHVIEDSGIQLLLVKVTVTQNTYFREKYGADGTLFYSTDEPLLRDETSDYFFETFEDAMAAIKEWEIETDYPSDLTCPFTLDRFRKDMCYWLVKNHDAAAKQSCTCGCREVYRNLAPKTEGVDWFLFNANNIPKGTNEEK